MPPKLHRTTDNWMLTGSTMFRGECVTWAGGFDARLGSFADGFIARKIALRYWSRKSSLAGSCSRTASCASKSTIPLMIACTLPYPRTVPCSLALVSRPATRLRINERKVHRRKRRRPPECVFESDNRKRTEHSAGWLEEIYLTPLAPCRNIDISLPACPRAPKSNYCP
jgi:hypothetical protein